MNKEIDLFIRENFYKYLDSYNSKKYPFELYSEFRSSFAELKPSKNDILNAINWKYGNLNKSNSPKVHKAIICKIIELWPDFATSESTNSDHETFLWWKNHLTNDKAKRFITVSFITHLVHFKSDFPIIDQHNFRAMNFMLNSFMFNTSLKKSPSNWEDIQMLKSFINEVSKTHVLKKGDIDKFLMMYGKELKKQLKCP
jgi:hypothetical protein